MLPATDLIVLAEQCAPYVHVVTTKAIVRQESGGNQFAIGVVGGALIRQPRALDEAVATARQLEADGRNYSVGLAQINKANFTRLGLTIESAFDPCTNLTAMQSVLHECWARAQARADDGAFGVRGALHCYYSGSVVVGRHAHYVDSVVANAVRVRAALVQPAVDRGSTIAR